MSGSNNSGDRAVSSMIEDNNSSDQAVLETIDDSNSSEANASSAVPKNSNNSSRNKAEASAIVTSTLVVSHQHLMIVMINNHKKTCK